MWEYKNYFKVIIPGLAMSIAAGIILETSKTWIQSEEYRFYQFPFQVE